MIRLIVLKHQLARIHNSSPVKSHSARNLGCIFDEYLTFSDQITSISKACYCHIHQLCCIRPYLDLSTACTIATSIVHSKPDHCDSSYYKLCSLNYPISSRSRTLLLVLSLKLSSVISLPSYALSTGSRITERIEYKLLTFTYKVLTTTQPPYLYNLISVQHSCSTHSSSVVTVAWPPISTSLKIADRSFCYASPCHWNQLFLASSTSFWC